MKRGAAATDSVRKKSNSLVEKYEPENGHNMGHLNKHILIVFLNFMTQSSPKSETVPWKANMTQQHVSLLFLYSTETLTDTAFQ